MVVLGGYRIVVIMQASQAWEEGSIPFTRSFFSFLFDFIGFFSYKESTKLLLLEKNHAY